MPLYDIRCNHCEGIFEKQLPISELQSLIECNYCKQQTAASPMMTGSVKITVTEKWRPKSGAEQLAGPATGGPGTSAKSSRSTILHVCKGFQCSVCA